MAERQSFSTELEDIHTKM